MHRECEEIVQQPSHDVPEACIPTVLNDESGAQAGCNDGVVVLARRGAWQVYTVTSNKHEHLSVLSCINVGGKCIPIFYILKGKQKRKNYVKRCETWSCTPMQLKA